MTAKPLSSQTHTQYSSPLIFTILIAAAILATAISYVFALVDRPMLHDDLNYLTSSMQWVNNHHPAWLRFPTHIAGSWLSVNGRMGELTTVIFYAMAPRWLHITLIGIMMAAMYVMVCLWVRRLGGRLLTLSLTLLFLYYGMAWWDQFTLFIMHNNYIWGAAISLAALWIILRIPMRRRRSLLWLPLIYIAGQWHEASGIPFACGLALYIYLNRKNPTLNKINRWLAYAFMAGAAVSILSPGILHRAAGHTLPDERLWYMLLVSTWMVGILVATCIAITIYSPHTLRRLIRQQWGIFAISALVGLCICAYSGSFGRTGWFAQISAWIALCGLINALPSSQHADKTFRYTGMITIPIVTTAIILSSIGYAVYQHHLNRQCRDIITQYIDSPDGVVFVDLATPSQAPRYLMGRAWGWPGIYDTWARYNIERTYSGDKLKPLTVLPAALRDLTPADTLIRKHIGTSVITYPSSPDNAVTNTYDPAAPPRIYAFRTSDGTIYTRQKFIYRGAYGVIDTPADLAPGERYPNINTPMLNPPSPRDIPTPAQPL